MNIDHIGVVVRSIDEGVALWNKQFGYQKMTGVVVNSRQKVKVQFLSKEGSIPIKLIEPVDSTSSVFALAQRGGGLHHLCFKCDDLNKQMETIKSMGLRILSTPQPGEAFENNDIAFYYAGQGLNIELIDTEKKASLIKGE